MNDMVREWGVPLLAVAAQGLITWLRAANNERRIEKLEREHERMLEWRGEVNESLRRKK